MASDKKFRALQKRNRRACHGRKPCKGRPRSQFKQR
jgi:hypothetical protein